MKTFLKAIGYFLFATLISRLALASDFTVVGPLEIGMPKAEVKEAVGKTWGAIDLTGTNFFGLEVEKAKIKITKNGITNIVFLVNGSEKETLETLARKFGNPRLQVEQDKKGYLWSDGGGGVLMVSNDFLNRSSGPTKTAATLLSDNDVAQLVKKNPQWALHKLPVEMIIKPESAQEPVVAKTVREPLNTSAVQEPLTVKGVQEPMGTNATAAQKPEIPKVEPKPRVVLKPLPPINPPSDLELKAYRSLCVSDKDARLKDPASAHDITSSSGFDGDKGVVNVTVRGRSKNGFGGVGPFSYMCQYVHDKSFNRVFRENTLKVAQLQWKVDQNNEKSDWGLIYGSDAITTADGSVEGSYVSKRCSKKTYGSDGNYGISIKELVDSDKPVRLVSTDSAGSKKTLYVKGPMYSPKGMGATYDEANKSSYVSDRKLNKAIDDVVGFGTTLEITYSVFLGDGSVGTVSINTPRLPLENLCNPERLQRKEEAPY